MTTRRTFLTGVMATAALAGCAPEPVKPEVTSPDATPSAPPSPAQTPAQVSEGCMTRVKQLSLHQQVAQLYMVAVSSRGLNPATAKVISDLGITSVILLEQSTAGAAAITKLTNEIRALGATELPILIAADQEGGQIQRLSGKGFDTIPSAVEQAKMPPLQLREQAAKWGSQLSAAGVRFNLAPVGDVTPAAKLNSNQPVGKLDRGYGSDPELVAEKVMEFVQGMASANVATSVKHFPGLGQVTANTDFSEATDSVTADKDPAWRPFEAAISAGVSSVMVSSAIYTRIDPKNPALYSKAIVSGILRGQLGFDRVIISDDVATPALKSIPDAERGTRFLQAGGDLVLDGDPGKTAARVSHTVKLAESDPAFAAQVASSAARVLDLKASVNLVDCGY